jgi:hypothetical protein
MDIQIGDVFRWKDGSLFEITGEWGKNEYRGNSYHLDGKPACGLNGQHNTAVNVCNAITNEEMIKIEKPRTKKFFIHTCNYGNYFVKRFLVDNTMINA